MAFELTLAKLERMRTMRIEDILRAKESQFLEIAVTAAKERFTSSHEKPGGAKWKALSKATESWSKGLRKVGDQPLYSSGRMYNANDARIVGASIMMSSNLDKIPPAQHFGREFKKNGMQIPETKKKAYTVGAHKVGASTRKAFSYTNKKGKTIKVKAHTVKAHNVSAHTISAHTVKAHTQDRPAIPARPIKFCEADAKRAMRVIFATMLESA